MALPAVVQAAPWLGVRERGLAAPADGISGFREGGSSSPVLSEPCWFNFTAEFLDPMLGTGQSCDFWNGPPGLRGAWVAAA